MRETDVFTVRTEAGREYTIRAYGTDQAAGSPTTSRTPPDEVLLTAEGFFVNRDGDTYYIVQTRERARRTGP